MAQKRNFFKIVISTIRRFSQDLLGLLLIAFAIISFLIFFNITQGSITQFLSDWMSKGLGLGSYLFALLLGYSGLLLLMRHLERFPRIDFRRIAFLELAFFSLLPLFALLGGLSIDRAENGLDGGLVGWGLARILADLLGYPIASLIFLFFFLLFFISGIGFWTPLIRKLDDYFISLLGSSPRAHVGKGFTPGAMDDEIEYQSVGHERDGKVTQKPTQKIQQELPPLSILSDSQKNVSDESYIHAKAIQIEKTLEEFGIPARVAGYRVGPTIIQYAVEPGFVEKVNEDGDIVRKKIRVSQISALNRDLKLALAVDRLRIEAPIPNHSFVGIEVPNLNGKLVRLKEILQSDDFQKYRSPLSLALGLNVSGNPVFADLSRMPHLLLAGTTGSGKSVCMTSLITCLAFNNSPQNLKVAILDPKMVELVRFNGLPHLLGKVESQIDRMLGILAWAIKEMEDRYRLLESINARDLETYNEKMFRRGGKNLPKIVILIDELADLMLTAPEQTEGYLVRLAQMARATGIHLVVATQRPSSDIVTGLIKANFPARISFMVASSVDSRVILDTNGAETLMGKGDMLFLDPEASSLQRAQSVIVDDHEIEKIIAYWQNKEEESDFSGTAPWDDLVPMITDDADQLINKAIELIRSEGRASTSWLQRKLRIGFPRAARLMDELEERGIVGPSESGGKEREIIKSLDDPESE